MSVKKEVNETKTSLTSPSRNRGTRKSHNRSGDDDDDDHEDEVALGTDSDLSITFLQLLVGTTTGQDTQGTRQKSFIRTLPGGMGSSVSLSTTVEISTHRGGKEERKRRTKEG